ncbi:hypothetical protein [Roseivivax sp. CAU 1761]
MRVSFPAAIAALLAGAGMAGAQMSDDELQRCVWRCLAGFGPAENPAYHQCVERQCSPGTRPAAPAQSRPAPADPTAAWQAGRSSDGTGFAGIDGAAGRTGLYYLCRGGRGTLRLVGLPAAGGAVVEVDGRAHRPGFRAAGGHAEAALAPGAALLAALRSGRRVRVTGDDGRTLLDLPLAGSGRALGQVIAGC